MKRRSFLKSTAGAVVLAGLGDFEFLGKLPRVSAVEARLPAQLVKLHPEVESLVRLLEETPRERAVEEFAARVKRGTSYREVLAAILLAGVRNIQPRPVGFKFHAVLVVNSAHLASLSSPDTDRWLPIFWAIDQFKSSQARDVEEGDWAMDAIDESAMPPSHLARRALIEAMDNWDEAAADVAIVGLCRTAGAHEVFEILSRHASTFTNAMRYAFQRCRDEETRKLLVLQNAAFLPLFRGNNPDKGTRIDSLEPAPPDKEKPDAMADIFADVSRDRSRASRKLLQHLQSNSDPKPFADAARRLIFLKGRDSHDYKFSSAILEDCHFMTPPWRDRFLAASTFYLKGSGDPDNQLVQRIRAALT